MIFYGTPNMGVYERPKPYAFKRIGTQKKKLIFRFDENGEFETTDEQLINRLVRKFKHQESKEEIPFSDEIPKEQPKAERQSIEKPHKERQQRKSTKGKTTARKARK